jgi:hypothetical protein
MFTGLGLLLLYGAVGLCWLAPIIFFISDLVKSSSASRRPSADFQVDQSVIFNRNLNNVEVRLTLHQSLA